MSAEPTAVLAGLRARFLRRAAGDLAELRAHRDAGAMASDDLRFVIHRLSGAGGSFGFPALSAAAARAEAEWLETGAVGADALAVLIGELEALPDPG